ncbi:hypothetical protein RSOL_392690, partial [Rhizoctonia solani AG-3 Rhs1AP]
MPDKTICRELMLDIHPKFKLDDPVLRAKAVKDLRAAFAQSHPSIRFVYHQPNTSARKPEHIYVLFYSIAGRQKFYKRKQDPLRLTFNYHGGHTVVPDSDMQAKVKVKVKRARPGTLYGPLFDRAEPQVQSGSATQGIQANDRNEPPVDQARRKRSRGETKDEVNGRLDDLKRVRFEATEE